MWAGQYRVEKHKTLICQERKQSVEKFTPSPMSVDELRSESGSHEVSVGYPHYAQLGLRFQPFAMTNHRDCSSHFGALPLMLT